MSTSEKTTDPDAGPAFLSEAATAPWAEVRGASLVLRRDPVDRGAPPGDLAGVRLRGRGTELLGDAGTDLLLGRVGPAFLPQQRERVVRIAAAMAQRPPGPAPRSALQGAFRHLRSRLLPALPDRRGVARGSLRVALLRAGAQLGPAMAQPVRNRGAPLPGLGMGGDRHPCRDRDPASGRLRAGRPRLPRALSAQRRPARLPAADSRGGFAQRRLGVRGRGRGPAGSAEWPSSTGEDLGGPGPRLLYVAWWAWYRLTASGVTPNPVHLHNLGEVPSTMLSVCAAGVSAISGFFGALAPGTEGSFNLIAGYLLLGLLIAGVVWRVRSGSAPPRGVWVPVALALSFWALLGTVADTENARQRRAATSTQAPSFCS